MSVCLVQYMFLSCSIDLESICANKEIYNNNKLKFGQHPTPQDQKQNN